MARSTPSASFRTPHNKLCQVRICSSEFRQLLSLLRTEHVRDSANLPIFSSIVHSESDMPKKRKRRKRSSSLYTKGQLNTLADNLLHPLIQKHKELRIIDEMAHIVIEGDLRESLIKFLRFTLPQIVRELLSDDSSE